MIPHCPFRVPDSNLRAKLFRGVSEPTRLRILEELSRTEMRVADLVERTSKAQATISEHLEILRECGLVNSRAQGRSTYYSLSDNRISEMLELADGLVDRFGGHICACGRLEGPCDNIK